MSEKQTCRQCGCTDDDCSQCVKAQGRPCCWVEPDLCSRCRDENNEKCNCNCATKLLDRLMTTAGGIATFKNTAFSPNLSRPFVIPIKLTVKKRTTTKIYFPSYCPICGKKYQVESASVDENGG